MAKAFFQHPKCRALWRSWKKAGQIGGFSFAVALLSI
jgi:hypothetical protein